MENLQIKNLKALSCDLCAGMVRVSYSDINSSYEEVKKLACGRKACSVMLLVAAEVDAMASARMLTQQLRADNIAYTLRCVTNFQHVLFNRKHYLTEQITGRPAAASRPARLPPLCLFCALLCCDGIWLVMACDVSHLSLI